jgi:ribonuclease-3
LTQRRAALVSAPSLAAWALRLGLPAHLRLGRGEDQSGGRGKESILATALEAVLGALYLDGGLPPVTGLVAGLLDTA